MNIIGKHFISEKPSFMMEIPYTRTERTNFFMKKEFDDVKILKFESSVLIAVQQILSLITKLPTEFIGATKNELSNNLIINHKNNIIEIIALSIQNSRKKADPDLIKFIDDNLNTDQLMEALNYTMICLNLESLLMGFMVFKPSILSSFDSAKSREPEVRKITSGSILQISHQSVV